MATTLYFRAAAASTHRGAQSQTLNGNLWSWWARALATARGATTISDNITTGAGPTNGFEVWDDGSIGPIEWISEPLDQDITISGTITHNLWAHESAMTVNAGMQVVIERLDSQGGIISTVSNSEQGTELGTTNPPTSARNWTNAAPTSTAFLKGDRIRIRVAANDAGGTIAAGTVTFWFDGPTSGENGDSYITFTETFGFLTTTPTGSQLFLTDVAGPAVGANIEKEMWTSRGDGVNTAVRNTVAGWTAPAQWTNTAGGTNIEWYSKQLQAFTLSGLVHCRMRVAYSNSAANAGFRVELAVVNNDGSGETIWAAACFNDLGAGELSLTESPYTVPLAGDDLAVSDGQRLRFRIFVDDPSTMPMVASGYNCTLWYDGTTADASGDSWVRLTETVSEYTPAAPGPIFKRRPGDRFMTRR